MAQSPVDKNARTLSPEQSQSGDISTMTDIHDIKPPEKFGYNPMWLWYGVAIILLFIITGLLVMIYRYFKKRRNKIESAVSKLSPEETAYRLLREIKGLRDSNGKEYYFKLSAIFRGYIQERFDIDALEMTTEELLPKVLTLKFDPDLKSDIKSFINISDPVKFAGVQANAEKMQEHYMLVKNFVKRTTPVISVMEQAKHGKGTK